MVVENITAVAAPNLATTIGDLINSAIALLIAVFTGVGLIVKWWRDNVDTRTSRRRDSRVVDGLENIVNSLKSTDYAVKEHADLIKGVTNLLLKVPEIKKPLEENKELLEKINKDVNDWEESIKSYYGNKSKSTPGDDSSDEIVARVAKVEKETLSD